MALLKFKRQKQFYKNMNFKASVGSHYKTVLTLTYHKMQLPFLMRDYVKGVPPSLR